MAKRKQRNRAKAKRRDGEPPTTAEQRDPAPAKADADEPARDEPEQTKPIPPKPSRDKPRRTDQGSPAKRKGGIPAARTLRDAKVEQPQFWFGFEVSWAKILTTRVVFFGLLALDALLQIRHAPRYGAGDFNVANLGFLDGFGPGRVGYGVGQLLISYLLVLAALGVATRVVLPIATVIYAWLYFGSQLDSYQHHYLVSLVLAISCFVPWRRPTDATPETPVRSWAVRLLLVQLGIMYLWAAISKLDPMWLDGTTLQTQIVGSMKSLIEGTVGFRGVSIIVIVVEFTLALTVWLRPTWVVAAPLGVLFHIGIVITGFEIGLFAYLMVAIYILVVPDRVWITIGRALVDVGTKLRGLASRPGWLTTGAAIVAAICVAIVVRLPHAIAVVSVLSIVPIAITLARPNAVLPIAHLAAIVLWLAVDRTTTVAEEYYRFWGGAQRRIGDKSEAEAAYRKLISIAPGDVTGHYQLGRILLGTERFDDGLDELHEAQRLDPKQARAYVEEARWLAGRGRVAEAIAKVRDATVADPSDAAARALLDSLTHARPAPPPPPDREP